MTAPATARTRRGVRGRPDVALLLSGAVLLVLAALVVHGGRVGRISSAKKGIIAAICSALGMPLASSFPSWASAKSVSKKVLVFSAGRNH